MLSYFFDFLVKSIQCNSDGMSSQNASFGYEQKITDGLWFFKEIHLYNKKR